MGKNLYILDQKNALQTEGNLLYTKKCVEGVINLAMKDINRELKGKETEIANLALRILENPDLTLNNEELELLKAMHAEFFSFRDIYDKTVRFAKNRDIKPSSFEDYRAKIFYRALFNNIKETTTSGEKILSRGQAIALPSGKKVSCAELVLDSGNNTFIVNNRYLTTSEEIFKVEGTTIYPFWNVEKDTTRITFGDGDQLLSLISKPKDGKGGVRFIDKNDLFYKINGSPIKEKRYENVLIDGRSVVSVETENGQKYIVPLDRKEKYLTIDGQPLVDVGDRILETPIFGKYQPARIQKDKDTNEKKKSFGVTAMDIMLLENGEAAKSNRGNYITSLKGPVSINGKSIYEAYEYFNDIYNPIMLTEDKKVLTLSDGTLVHHEDIFEEGVDINKSLIVKAIPADEVPWYHKKRLIGNEEEE